MKRMMALFMAMGVGFLVARKTQAETTGEWINPGGKWMPQQMTDNAEILKKLGIEIDPAELADPSSKLMKAIVSLGGCSGSLVSKTGLIATNHHCVQKILTYLSKIAKANGSSKDFTKDGYVARSQDQELHGGPTERIYITQKFVNVTDQIRGGLENIADPAERGEEMERRVKAVQEQAEKGHKNIRADVVSFFSDEQFYLIVKLEIKDVRLVFAPPDSVGSFGGDDDNWQWPRHSGDFALIRAYVGPDGQPATYSPHNVPYVPEEALKISAEGLKPNDLIMVAGYPGRSYRLNTADQIRFQITHDIPFIIPTFEKLIGVMDEMSKASKENAIRLEDRRRSIMNSLLYYKGSYEGLTQIDFVHKKQQFEDELQAWINADPVRTAKYGTVLKDLANARTAIRQNFKFNYLFQFMTTQTQLLASALAIVRMAIERAKPDNERRLGYQERDQIRLRQAEQSMQAGYKREVDLELLKFFVTEISALPSAQQPSWLTTLYDPKSTTTIEQQLAKIYAATQLENVDQRLRLLETASVDDLKASSDPLIQLALLLTKTVDSLRSISLATSGTLIFLTPKYIEALREHAQGRLAPDANSTLRITFGQVKGTTDPTTGDFSPPITTTSQMLDKVRAHNGQPPYDAPSEVMAAATQRNFGVYGDRTYHEMPIDVLSTVDITGGNSGSAGLNKKGELIGLLFDGTSGTLYSDWHFDEKVRAILVDARYMLWMIDKVYGASNIMQELDISYSPCQLNLLNHSP